MPPGADWDPTARVPWECGSILEEIRGMHRVAICCTNFVWICEISKIGELSKCRIYRCRSSIFITKSMLLVFPYSGVTHSNMRHVFWLSLILRWAYLVGNQKFHTPRRIGPYQMWTRMQRWTEREAGLWWQKWRQKIPSLFGTPSPLAYLPG